MGRQTVAIIIQFRWYILSHGFKVLGFGEAKRTKPSPQLMLHLLTYSYRARGSNFLASERIGRCSILQLDTKQAEDQFLINFIRFLRLLTIKTLIISW